MFSAKPKFIKNLHFFLFQLSWFITVCTGGGLIKLGKLNWCVRKHNIVFKSKIVLCSLYYQTSQKLLQVNYCYFCCGSWVIVPNINIILLIIFLIYYIEILSAFPVTVSDYLHIFYYQIELFLLFLAGENTEPPLPWLFFLFLPLYFEVAIFSWEFKIFVFWFSW